MLEDEAKTNNTTVTFDLSRVSTPKFRKGFLEGKFSALVRINVSTLVFHAGMSLSFSLHVLRSSTTGRLTRDVCMQSFVGPG